MDVQMRLRNVQRKNTPPKKGLIITLGAVMFWFGFYLCPFGQDILFYIIKNAIRTVNVGLPDEAYDYLTWYTFWIISAALMGAGLILMGRHVIMWRNFQKNTRRVIYGKKKKKRKKKVKRRR